MVNNDNNDRRNDPIDEGETRPQQDKEGSDGTEINQEVRKGIGNSQTSKLYIGINIVAALQRNERLGTVDRGGEAGR